MLLFIHSDSLLSAGNDPQADVTVSSIKNTSCVLAEEVMRVGPSKSLLVDTIVCVIQQIRSHTCSVYESVVFVEAIGMTQEVCVFVVMIGML